MLGRPRRNHGRVRIIQADRRIAARQAAADDRHNLSTRHSGLRVEVQLTVAARAVHNVRTRNCGNCAARPARNTVLIGEAERAGGAGGIQIQQTRHRHRELLTGQVAVRAEIGAAVCGFALHDAACAQQGSIAVRPVRRGVREHVGCRTGGYGRTNARAVACIIGHVGSHGMRTGRQHAGCNGHGRAAHHSCTGNGFAVHLDRNIACADRILAVFHGGSAGKRGICADADRCRGRIQLDRRRIRIRHRMICAQYDLVEVQRRAAGACAGFVKPQTGELLCAVRHACRQLFPAVAGCSGQGSGQLIAFCVGKHRCERACRVPAVRPQCQVLHARSISRRNGNRKAVRTGAVPHRLERTGAACHRGVIRHPRECYAVRCGQIVQTVFKIRNGMSALRVAHTDIDRNGLAYAAIRAGERAGGHPAARSEHAVRIYRTDIAGHAPLEAGIRSAHRMPEVICERIHVDALARFDRDRAERFAAALQCDRVHTGGDAHVHRAGNRAV